MSNSKCRRTRRSELSFAGAENGSLDDDYILQLNLEKDIETLENSEASCIQNILNDFDNKITQEKKIKASHTTAKKTSKASKKSIEKSPITSPIKYQTSNVPGTSSNANSTVETKTTKKRSSVKPRHRKTSKMVEETNPQENVCDIDNMKEDIPNLSKTNVQKNVNANKKIIKKEISERKRKTTTEKKSTTRNKKSKIEDFENKVTKVQRENEEKASEKIAKDQQSENIESLLDEKKENNKKKNAESKKCNCRFSKKYPLNDLEKIKLKKTNSKKKRQENTQANKLPPQSEINNVKSIKESCAKCSNDQKLRKKAYEDIKTTSQSIKNFSRYIRKQMRNIQNNLKDPEASSSEYSSYSSDSYLSCSCSNTDCECSDYSSDDFEDYTSGSFETLYTSSSDDDDKKNMLIAKEVQPKIKHLH